MLEYKLLKEKLCLAVFHTSRFIHSDNYYFRSLDGESAPLSLSEDDESAEKRRGFRARTSPPSYQRGGQADNLARKYSVIGGEWDSFGISKVGIHTSNEHDMSAM
jgi:hypothetical protein